LVPSEACHEFLNVVGLCHSTFLVVVRVAPRTSLPELRKFGDIL
jgi:hypothetical protein